MELEELVVRIAGDIEEFKASLKEAVESTKQAADAVKTQAAVMEAALTLAGAVGGLATLKDFLNAFSEEEIAIVKLTAVMESNGREVEGLIADYSAFATAMEETTIFADETTLALLKQAESFGLTGEAAKRTVEDARALATINDSSAEAMIRITAAMAEGDVERAMMFSRMIPQLRGIKDEATFVARYTKLAAAGMEAMHEEAKTATGRIKQAANAFSNFKEQLGAILANIVAPIFEFFAGLSRVLMAMPGWIKTVLVGAVALSAALLAWAGLKVVIVAAFAVIKTAALALVTNPFTAWLVAIGLVVAAIAVLVNKLRGARAEARETAASLAAATEVRRTVSARTDVIVEESRLVADLAARRAMLSLELEAVRAEYDRLEASRRLLTVTTATVEEMTALVDRAHVLGAEIARLDRTARTATLEAGSFASELRRAADTVGMTTEETRRFDLAARGASAGTLALVDAWIRWLDLTRRTDEARRSMADMFRGFETSFATMGLSAREAEVERFAMSVRDLSPVFGMWAESMRSAARHLDMLDEARGIIEEIKTPAERLAERQARLRELFDAGTLSVDQYTRALTAAARGVANLDQVQRDAVATGSAEAFARLQTYRENLMTASASLTVRTATAPRPGAPTDARSVEVLTSIRDILRAIERRPGVPLLPAPIGAP